MNKANGYYSFVAGNNNTANGENSTALGKNNTADAPFSFAAGLTNTASGNGSFALGLVNNAIGLGSFALGTNNTSKGLYSFAAGEFNNANKESSFAAGKRNTSNGLYSFAAGDGNNASERCSIALGGYNTSEGEYSVAAGLENTASGNHSFSVGKKNEASGECSIAAGLTNTASNSYSIAAGYNNTASGEYSVAAGYNNTASGECSIAVGNGNTASGECSMVLGGFSKSGAYSLTAGYESTAEYYSFGCGTRPYASRDSVAENKDCIALYNSHAEGRETAAFKSSTSIITLDSIDAFNDTLTCGNTLSFGSGSQYIIYATPESITEINVPPVLIEISNRISGNMYAYSRISKGIITEKHLNCIRCSTNIDGSSHSEGIRTIACEKASHAEGFGTIAYGEISHAEGMCTTTWAKASHAGGVSSQTMAEYSFVHGEGVMSINTPSQAVLGKYNDISTASDNIFVVGNGTSDSERSNAFRVTTDGKVYSKGEYNNTGADYAEMFEWSDGNLENEDRVGYFVTFDTEDGSEDKIRIANSNDEYILGITSATPCIVGDNYSEDWHGKYETDKFGRIIYETVTITEEGKDEYGHTTTIEKQEKIPKLSADYSASEKYIPREERPEWTTVGFVGKLLVYHDGTIKPGNKCKPNDNGIATLSTDGTGYYVMSVKDDVAKILFK